jgi:hypothetical protein
MAGKDFLASGHILNGLYPKADQFATSATTDYISCRDYRRIGFIIHTGDATAGTADGVVTVNAATTAAGAGATAMAFHYRVCLSSATVDTWGSMTAAAAAGFAMTAGDNYMYYIEVDAAEVQAAVAGADFVSLTVTEDTNDPIVAGVVVLGLEPRYGGDIPLTAIA